jgi:tripartite-type tricarboxylate transporter receptor subunit TctC
MIRIVAALLLMCSAALAEPKKVDIVTRLGPTTAHYVYLNEFVRELNETQDEYEYRVSVVPGAQGETAFKRFVSINEEEKRDAILYSSQVTFSDPKYGNRMNDFNYVTTLSMSVASLMIKDKTVTSLDEFVQKIRSKDVTYFGATVSSNTGAMLNEIFVKQFGLESKVKRINYANPQEILRAVLVGESDYTIFNPESIYAHLNMLVVANSSRPKAYPNVPTGKEIGFIEFDYSSFSLLAIPKSNQKLYDNILASFMKACNSENVRTLIEKRNSMALCMTNQQIVEALKKERNLLVKYNISSED